VANEGVKQMSGWLVLLILVVVVVVLTAIIMRRERSSRGSTGAAGRKPDVDDRPSDRRYNI
jgi:hypothetical protein